MNNLKRKTGTCRAWWPNGKRRYILNYGVDDRLDGLQEWFNQNGSVKDKWEYRDGTPVDGLRVSTWGNGAPMESIHLKNGVPDGDHWRWSQDGFVLEHWVYNSGIPKDGRMVCYFSPNAVQSEASFFKGKKNGVELRFDESGKIWLEINWQNGLPEGLATEREKFSQYNQVFTNMYKFKAGRLQSRDIFDINGSMVSGQKRRLDKANDNFLDEIGNDFIKRYSKSYIENRIDGLLP